MRYFVVFAFLVVVAAQQGVFADTLYKTDGLYRVQEQKLLEKLRYQLQYVTAATRRYAYPTAVGILFLGCLYISFCVGRAAGYRQGKGDRKLIRKLYYERNELFDEVRYLRKKLQQKQGRIETLERYVEDLRKKLDWKDRQNFLLLQEIGELKTQMYVLQQQKQKRSKRAQPQQHN